MKMICGKAAAHKAIFFLQIYKRLKMKVSCGVTIGNCFVLLFQEDLHFNPLKPLHTCAPGGTAGCPQVPPARPLSKPRDSSEGGRAAFHSSLTPEVVPVPQEEGEEDLAAGHKQSDAQDSPRPHAETRAGYRGQGEAGGGPSDNRQ